jgi:hypothetical protein
MMSFFKILWAAGILAGLAIAAWALRGATGLPSASVQEQFTADTGCTLLDGVDNYVSDNHLESAFHSSKYTALGRSGDLVEDWKSPFVFKGNVKFGLVYSIWGYCPDNWIAVNDLRGITTYTRASNLRWRPRDPIPHPAGANIAQSTVDELAKDEAELEPARRQVREDVARRAQAIQRAQHR